MQLSGKVAVVTGASGGMGQAIVRRLSEAGARVYGLGVTAPGNDEAPRPADSSPPDVTELTCDVSSHQEVGRAFDRVVSEAEHIDVLVNAAGIREVSHALDLEPDEWDRVISVNLSGVFYCCQAAARAMLRRGGSIINISSAVSSLAVKKRTAYTASKHGVIGLTRSLAADLGAHRIRVNAICPGLIRTPLTEAYFGEDGFREGLREVIPLEEYGTPDDIAGSVLFLASDHARYITGATLLVDGGWSAEKGFVTSQRAPGSAFTSAYSVLRDP